jgi:hypothetical protein
MIFTNILTINDLSHTHKTNMEAQTQNTKRSIFIFPSLTDRNLPSSKLPLKHYQEKDLRKKIGSRCFL